MKIGISGTPSRRVRELNVGYPVGANARWSISGTRKFETARAAYDAEGVLLQHLADEGLWLSGEFAFVADHDLAGLARSMRTTSEAQMADAAVIASIQAKLERLTEAIDARLNRTRCLRRWSEFIRERDGQRCVDCHSTRNLSAHHICRKVLLPEAQYQTGNGITLCRECHREVHAGFNGRPNTSEPMDAQAGEKLRLIERLYCILDQDAVERGLLLPGFYELDEQVLAKFKLFQGFAWETPFPGPPVRQAYLIWAQSGLAVRQALAEASGFEMTDQPILPGEAFVVWAGETGQPSAGIIRNPRWY